MIDGAGPHELPVTHEVRGLAALTIDELKDVWRRRYGAPPTLRSVDLVRRLLAWRIQADALGGLSSETKAALTRTSATLRGPTATAGDRLTREWRGVRHEVEVLEEGVLYRGQRYASLSEVARAITASRWNGPRFFGLTLNVLLSFAQFEREVTGERIRDKIAASKAKGMWMGGIRPLGYDSRDHRLVVNEAEAETVRSIFAAYLKIGSVHALRDQLEREGVRSKTWVTSTGRTVGGNVFARGALFHLLQNRHYLGEICHHKATYPGQHRAIVDAKLFEAVQKKLAKNRVRRRERRTMTDVARLTGRIFDDESRPFSPAFSYGRSGRRYGYYVRGDVQAGRARADRSDGPCRIPTEALDSAILALLQRLSGSGEGDWQRLGPMLRKLEVRAEEARLMLDAERVFEGDHPELAFEDLLGRLVGDERAVMMEKPKPTIVVAVPGRLRFRGGRTWRSGPRHHANLDPILAGALRSAHRSMTAAGCSPTASPSALVGARAPANVYARKLCALVFLAPSVQAAILAGRQPLSLTLSKLLSIDLPLAWKDQERLLGVSAAAAAFARRPA
jgi:hypothetical protein